MDDYVGLRGDVTYNEVFAKKLRVSREFHLPGEQTFHQSVAFLMDEWGKFQDGAICRNADVYNHPTAVQFVVDEDLRETPDEPLFHHMVELSPRNDLGV